MRATIEKLFILALTLAAVLVLAASIIAPSTRTNTVTQRVGAQTLYITNLAPKFISDAEITRSIPKWQRAVNVDFAGYWHTTQFKLVFLGRKAAPFGAMSAVFQNKGPVKGALAYHWTERGGAPSITVYAGTGAYYGYSNSVSFTHELSELAGDPVTSYVNEGYPSDYYWIEKKDTSLRASFQYGVVGWFSEVSDPVESDYYVRDGVKISDFVTPAWFNDGVGSRYDFMGLCQQPFWIRPGGYAQYLDANGWEVVTNFRHGRASDRGFYVLDPRGERS